MTLLPSLCLFFATPDAAAADIDASAAPIDRKTFGQPHNKGENRPRRKRRKRKDPYRGPFAKDKYPQREILRPLVLPKQMAEVGVSLDYSRPGGEDALSSNLNVNFGIGDIVEVGVNTGFNWVPDVNWNETIGLSARVLTSDGRRLDWAPGLDVLIPTGGGAGRLVVDLGARHLFSKRTFLTFGQGAIPITLGSDPVVTLVGNLGIGVQATKATVVIFETTAAQFQVVPSADDPVTGIWETFPLSATLQGSPNRMVDLGLRGTLTTIWEGPDFEGAVTGYANFRF